MTAIEATLAVAHGEPTSKDIRAGEFAVYATATVGALLKDPDQELAILKNGLNRWLPANRDTLTQLLGLSKQ